MLPDAMGFVSLPGLQPLSPSLGPGWGPILARLFLGARRVWDWGFEWGGGFDDWRE